MRRPMMDKIKQWFKEAWDDFCELWTENFW